MKITNWFEKIKKPNSIVGKTFKITVKSILQYLFAIFTFIVLYHAIIATSLVIGYEKFKKNLEYREPQNYYYCHDETFFGSTEPCKKDQLLETEKTNRIFGISFSIMIDTTVLLYPENSIKIAGIPGTFFTLIGYGVFLIILYRNYLKEFKQCDFTLIILSKKYKRWILPSGLLLYSVLFGFLLLDSTYSTPNENFDKYPRIDKVYRDHQEMSKEFNTVATDDASKKGPVKCERLPKVGAYYGVNKGLSDWGAYTHVYKLQDLCREGLDNVPYMNSANSICEDSVCQLKT